MEQLTDLKAIPTTRLLPSAAFLIVANLPQLKMGLSLWVIASVLMTGRNKIVKKSLVLKIIDSQQINNHRAL